LGYLSLGLSALGCGLIQAVLIVHGADLSELDMSSYAIAGLNVAEAAVRAADLVDVFDDTAGFEAQVNLGERFDTGGVALRRIGSGSGLDLLRDRHTDHLGYGFKRLLFTTAREKHERCYER
jgi:hypothetical protein